MFFKDLQYSLKGRIQKIQIFWNLEDIFQFLSTFLAMQRHHWRITGSSRSSFLKISANINENWLQHPEIPQHGPYQTFLDVLSWHSQFALRNTKESRNRFLWNRVVTEANHSKAVLVSATVLTEIIRLVSLILSAVYINLFLVTLFTVSESDNKPHIPCKGIKFGILGSLVGVGKVVGIGQKNVNIATCIEAKLKILISAWNNAEGTIPWSGCH